MSRGVQIYCAPYAPPGPRPPFSEGNLHLGVFGQKVGVGTGVVQKGTHWRPKFALFWQNFGKFGQIWGILGPKFKFLAKKFVKRRRSRYARRLPKTPSFWQKTRGVTAKFRPKTPNRPSRLAEFWAFFGKKSKNVKRRGVFFDVQFGSGKNMAAMGDWDGNIN